MKIISGGQTGVDRAAQRISEFISHHSISILNAAGPRAGGEPRAYNYAKKTFLITGGMIKG